MEMKGISLFLSKELFITIVISCLISIVLLWYNSSVFSYNSYNTICTSNYGKVEEYTDCMKPFFNQLTMSRLGIIITSIILFLSTLTFIFKHFKKTK